MARVPTWTELRMDATKLAQLQSECYQSVRDMIDKTIPEIDRKLELLNGGMHDSRQLHKSKPNLYETCNSQQLSKSKPNLYETCSNLQQDNLKPNPYETCISQQLTKSKQNFHETCSSQHFAKPGLYETGDQTTKLKSSLCETFGSRRLAKSKSNFFEPGGDQQLTRSKPNLDELEHLKPLPMPLSHYLRMNRPELVRAAERRVMYIRKKAERRKQFASSRTINALDMIRSSSRTISNKGTSSLRSSLRSSTRTVSRESVAPDYQVRYKLSEHEMRRLTARVYNRLPEVTRQRKEEVTKHMKVQNYKNKMEYGRKLLLNRRQGVINYPLRTNNDDSSIISSQEESLTNSLE